MKNWMDDTGLSVPLSPARQQQFLRKLWELLGWQVGQYTDNTSVTEETAQELLSSLRYTLSVLGLSPETLLSEPLEPLILEGQAILSERVVRARSLYLAVLQTAPAVENCFFQETLAQLGCFFQRYQLHFFAHRIPCDLDYPLLFPVPDDPPGVSFVEEYLRRLLLESQMLCRFDTQTLIRLLRSSVSDVREDYFNLCEQPLVNAVGRAMLNLPPAALNISLRERTALSDLIRSCSAEALRASLDRAMASVCGELRLPCNYFTGLTGGLLRRIAGEKADLSRIFVTILPENILYSR